MPYYHRREELLEQFVEQKERRRVKTLLAQRDRNDRHIQ